jgi:poly-beta-1,6-N-acetyl-D-glucosamine synthase
MIFSLAAFFSILPITQGSHKPGMTLFLVIIFAIYAAFVLMLLFGWARSMEGSITGTSRVRKISVVIPFRNEVANLNKLLESLQAQTYPREDFEVILVDDHSDDAFQEQVEKRKSTLHTIRILNLQNTVGKKAALTLGIAKSKGEVIATTDADCVPAPDWLKEINHEFDLPSVKMAIGAVRLEGDSWFARMQSLEMASLIGTSGATLGWGFPSMCNGANLSFLRSAFDEVDGYQGNETVPSGDDEFLMRKFFARWKNGLRFLNRSGTVVATSAQKKMTSFVAQRLRWAGKWKHNSHKSTRLMALAVLFFHLVFIGSFFTLMVGLINWRSFGLMWAAKIFVEALFLFSVARFLEIRWRWSIFFLLQFVYSFYVVSIGFASQVVTPKWKGRAV